MKLVQQLKLRDQYEKAHRDLFSSVASTSATQSTTDEITTELLREELRRRQTEITELKEHLEVSQRQIQQLNDDLITAQIETNVTTSKLNSLKAEHDKLLNRWLARVKVEVDHMNKELEK